MSDTPIYDELADKYRDRPPRATAKKSASTPRKRAAKKTAPARRT